MVDRGATSCGESERMERRRQRENCRKKEGRCKEWKGKAYLESNIKEIAYSISSLSLFLEPHASFITFNPYRNPKRTKPNQKVGSAAQSSG